MSPRTAAAPNTLAELQHLSLSRPGLDSPTASVAAWYERKAEVLEHLAAQGSPEVAELAATAHDHAIELTEEVAA